MSLTLYWGQDEKIRKHIKDCYNVVEEVFSELGKLEKLEKLENSAYEYIKMLPKQESLKERLNMYEKIEDFLMKVASSNL